MRCRQPSAKKYLLLCVSFLSLHTVAQTDTLYVKSYYNNVVPRFLYSYRNQVSSFVEQLDTSYSADRFTTGNQHFMGGDIGYKWITVGYNFSFNKETSSANTDLRFSTSYRHYNLQLNYTNLQNLNYYRLNGENEEDTAFIFKERGIRLRSAAFKMEYVFNYRQFCYSSAYSQGGRQLKSKGSFILSAGIAWQDINLRGLSDSSGVRFLNRYRANDFKVLRLDVGPGYAYNWVIRKNLVLCISEIPNIGFQQLTTSENGLYANHHPSVSFTNYVRAGLIYTWNRAFAGAHVYNSVTASEWLAFNYNSVYTSVQVYCGMVLGDPRSYTRRKRG